MRRDRVAAVAVVVALTAGGAGACGTEDPDAPSRPSRTPTDSGTPESQEPSRSADPTPRDTDDRPLPEECKRPAGGSVRQSCIDEYGPEGVGPVEPVPPEQDRNNNGIDDSVEEPQPRQDEDPTTEPEPSQEQGPTTESPPSEDEEPTTEPEPSDDESATEPEPEESDEQSP